MESPSLRQQILRPLRVLTAIALILSCYFLWRRDLQLEVSSHLDYEKLFGGKNTPRQNEITQKNDRQSHNAERNKSKEYSTSMRNKETIEDNPNDQKTAQVIVNDLENKEYIQNERENIENMQTKNVIEDVHEAVQRRKSINDIVDVGEMRQNVEDELNSMQSKILEIWGEERESFFTSVQFGIGSMKNQSREYVKRKMMKSLADLGTFRITTMGTSVAASHDNRFNQSFTAVLERELKPLFTSAGVELVVTNHAMGANPVNPMHYCVGTLGDLETDLYIYEFHMMMGRRPKDHFENFIRSAFVQPHQPIVTFVKADRSKRNTIHRNFNDFAAQYLGKNNQLQQHYRDFGINYWSIDDAVGSTGAQKDPHFQHQWTIQDKPFNKHKAWHPGPPGHYLVGMALAYSYAHVFVEAVQSVLDLKESGKYVDPMELDNPQAKLPNPLFGSCQNNPFCASPNTTCYTSIEPKGQEDMDLGRFVLNTEYEDTRPILPTPCGQPKDKPCLDHKNLTKWIMGIWPLDEKAVINSLEAHYLDRKWAFLGRQTSGGLELELQAPHPGTQIMFCHPSGDFGKYPDGLEASVQSYQVKVNEQVVKATKSGDMCGVVKTEIKPGRIKFLFKAPNENLMAISHIILP